MFKHTLLAASLALVLAGQAYAGDSVKRDPDAAGAVGVRVDPNFPAPKSDEHRKQKVHRDLDRVEDRQQPAVIVRDWRDNDPREIDGRRDDERDRRHDLPGRVWRAVDHRDDHDGDDNDWRHDDHDWRDHDGDHDWRDRDRRRDNDWRRLGWTYHGWRNDGWRYYRSHDNRRWRYCPPYRYSLDNGYRSGYELAWRDWLNYGRHDRYWRRGSFLGFGIGSLYRAGYDAGWRDAAYYYDRGYRPDFWGYDPQGGWFFSFRIEG